MKIESENVYDGAKFAVVLDDPSFCFNAMHFVTFRTPDGEWVSESIHGHDFRVGVTIVGPLDESGCVIDFVRASAAVKENLRNWDRKLILPCQPLDAEIADGDDDLTTIDYNSAPCLHYVFPTSEVVTIEASNATTEEIAASLLERLIGDFASILEPVDLEQYTFRLRLEETPGCSVEIEL